MLACAARAPRASPFPRGTSVRFASGRLLEPELRSDSGVIYKLDESSVGPPVYESSADGQKYYVRVIAHKEDFENHLRLQSMVSLSPYVRIAMDTIQEHQALVYPSRGLLSLRRPKTELPFSARRRILRDALRGLADLHESGIVHDKLGPWAIFYEDTESPNKNGKIGISANSVILSPESWVTGPGPDSNEPHRSPEAWCKARRNQASDVFSFGTLIIYAMAAKNTKKLPFDVDPTKSLLFKDRWYRALLRQISMCADNEAFKGFLQHIGSEHPFQKHLVRLKREFDEDHSYRRAPIATSNFLALQPDAADLVAQMMNMDPARRITAREALGHGYFLINEEDTSPPE